MDRNELQQKLTQPFDPDQWKEVVETVFPGSQFYSQERRIETSEEIVEQIADKGTVRLADGKNIALVELRLKPGSVHLQKNRVKLRSLVAKLIDQERAHGVVAVFEQGEGDYRLSFIAKEAVLEDGEFKVRETPAKRFTYLLGPGESCRTAAERLYALSQKQEITLDDVTDAFSVEKLNKEFYRHIQKYFYKLIGGKVDDRHDFTGCMTLPSKPIEDQANHRAYSEFAVRLLGRVVFCWFLKHKRCDQNRPLIPDELLSSKAVEEHTDYYHRVLEKLFFQTLNKPMNQRSKYAPEFAHLIPYLNGGLFEPHKDDFYKEGAIGESEFINTLLIPDDWFKEFFQTLEMYNFTIDENTALDNEVSIDPEILGRIFENLLAEINPETGDSARKATGSFYTPREIVDYMVEESLMQHLKTALGLSAPEGGAGSPSTPSESAPSSIRENSCEFVGNNDLEQKLRALFVDDDNPHNLDDSTRRAVVDAFRTIKVLDPACGSGAFPVGILQKMLCALRKVDPENDLWLDAQIAQIQSMKLSQQEEARRLDEIDHAFKTNEADYGRKLGIIQNSVYGVDIQPIAIEISKLRFFLTLVVDEKIEENEDNRGILPLPNLDFKFVCANTLIPAPEIENTTELDLEYYPDFFDDFTALTEQYFYAGTPKEKLAIRTQLSDCVGKKIHGELDKVHALQGEDLFELHGLSKAKQKRIKDRRAKLVRNISLWQSYKNIFSGETVGFFDPKYMFPDAAHGFDVVIANPPYVQIQKLPEAVKEQLKTVGYLTFGKTADLYCLFYECGLRSLCPDGVLTFISSNKFFRAGYGKALRKLLNEEKELRIIIDFGELPVFEAGTDPCIISVVNRFPGIGKIRAAIIKEKSGIQNVYWTVNETGFELARDGVSMAGWTLENPRVILLLEKLSNTGTPLGKYVNGRFYRGILTGYNEAFVIDRLTRDRLIAEDSRSAELIKPWLRGKDIKRWYADFNELYVINPHNGYGDVPPVEIYNYPAIKKHLNEIERKRAAGEFGEKAKNAKGLFEREDQGQTPYNLRSCAYVPEFNQPKIVFNETSKELHAFCDYDALCINKTGFIIINDDLEYLLGIMNSKMMDWFYRTTFPSWGDPWNGGRVQFRGDRMDKISIPVATPAQQEEIEERVEKILAQKKENPEADVTALEAEIDQLVYKLYDLTPEEIAIIEGKS